MIRRLFRRVRPRSGVGTAPAGTVRLPTHELLTPALDALAELYAADPQAVGRLLRAHAAHVLSLDLCAVDDDAANWQRAMAAEQADASRSALLDITGHAGRLDLVMSPNAADALATDLNHAATVARRQMNGEIPA